MLLDTIHEESALARSLTRKQEAEQIEAAKANGVTFYTLPLEEKAQLIEMAKPEYYKWGEKIGAEYLQQVRATLGK